MERKFIICIVLLAVLTIILHIRVEGLEQKQGEPVPVVIQINEPIQVEIIEPEQPEEPEAKQQFIISITEAEIDLLARLVSAEAKGESFEGMIAVANVVINRLNSPKWEADTIHEVIFEPKQFQPVSNGAINQEPTEDALNATIEALKGVTVVSDEVDCFAHKTINFSSWAVYNSTIGNHSFWVAK